MYILFNLSIVKGNWLKNPTVSLLPTPVHLFLFFVGLNRVQNTRGIEMQMNS